MNPYILYTALAGAVICLLWSGYRWVRNQALPKDTLPAGKSISKANSLLIPVIRDQLQAGVQTVTFRVHGRSMRPFLDNGRDKVILQLPEPDALKRGDVVLAEITPGFYVLHRIIRREGNQLTLKGDGNPVNTETCKVENVIGIAKGFLRKNRLQPDLVTDWKWRTYSKIWMALDPFRRYLLAIYRRTLLRL